MFTIDNLSKLANIDAQAMAKLISFNISSEKRYEYAGNASSYISSCTACKSCPYYGSILESNSLAAACHGCDHLPSNIINDTSVIYNRRIKNEYVKVNSCAVNIFVTLHHMHPDHIGFVWNVHASDFKAITGYSTEAVKRNIRYLVDRGFISVYANSSPKDIKDFNADDWYFMTIKINNYRNKYASLKDGGTKYFTHSLESLKAMNHQSISTIKLFYISFFKKTFHYLTKNEVGFLENYRKITPHAQELFFKLVREYGV